MYDERFFRMWEFYLAGGIVTFENGGRLQSTRSSTPATATRIADHPRLYG